MDAVKALKLSIIIQWSFIFISTALAFYEEAFLPEQLRLFIQSEMEKEITTAETIQFSISVIVLLIMFYISIAVYQLREWSRKPYIYLAVVGVLFYFVVGPQILTPASAIFDYISTVAVGVSIGLLYYSQASQYFGKTSKKE